MMRCDIHWYPRWAGTIVHSPTWQGTWHHPNHRYGKQSVPHFQMVPSMLRYCASVWTWRFLFPLFPFPFSISFLPCTISTTPDHGHDTEDLMWPKRPMTDRSGPLAMPEVTCTILTFHAHSPAPCGLLTLSRTFYLLFRLFILSLFIPFYSISCLRSIPFCSFRYCSSSLQFHRLLSLTCDLMNLSLYKLLYD